MATLPSIGDTFTPVDLRTQKPSFALPDEQWQSCMATPVRFPPAVFQSVLHNIIQNPNLASTYVFRAETFWDSDSQPCLSDNPAEDALIVRSTKHLKPGCRPAWIRTPAGYRWQRTLVVQQVPRNPQLDRPLAETVHIYEQPSAGTYGHEQRTLAVYVPHVQSAADVPYYHPPVLAFAVHHEWHPPSSRGALSLHYRLSSPTEAISEKINRVAYNYLKLVHKHGMGRLAGYQKRVQHDVVVGQKSFQDTYTRLKANYAKRLIDGWVEQTDPSKHVFEDLGIAAFLIELWQGMYAFDGSEQAKPAFTGFVDIGCGNGVLVYILNSEGYSGWGFDARGRKTWATFPAAVRQNLKESLLVPAAFQAAAAHAQESARLHNGVFPQAPFIISNHADELTAWTPLLAYMNDCPFIAIPCCSHNLAGARCRFSARPGPSSDAPKARTSGISDTADGHREHREVEQPAQLGPGPSSGSLAKPKNSSKQPSAYASLAAYVTSLTEELGFDMAKEMLRIPSTRNVAIIGRRRRSEKELSCEDRERRVRDIVSRELGDVTAGGRLWLERAKALAKGKGSGH